MTIKNLKEATARIEALEAALANALTTLQELQTRPQAKGRDYGPKSETKMTKIIAWRIKFGDRSGFKVKENSEYFGLSRGQVYSLDKYTFQALKEDSYNEDSPEYIASVEEFTKDEDEE